MFEVTKGVIKSRKFIGQKKNDIKTNNDQPTLHRKLKIQLLQLPCKHVVFL